MRFLRRALIAGAIAALLAGCGGEGGSQTKEEPPERLPRLREVSITLNGYRGPENIGILMAGKREYFSEANLSVFVSSPASPEWSARYVANGTVDFAVSHQPQVVLAKERGAPLVAVGSLISRPTSAVIWLEKSGIDEIADLEGKTVAIPGIRFQRELLQAILAQAGLRPGDVTITKVGYGLVPALLSGDADAIFGASANLEGAQLEARGLEPVVTPVQRLGVPGYDELVVVARADLLAKGPRVARAFMSAVARGTAAAIENPEEARDVIEESFETNPDTTPNELKSAFEATLPVLSRDGRMDPRQAEDLIAWMQEEGIIQREPAASALFSNRYLAQSP